MITDTVANSLRHPLAITASAAGVLGLTAVSYRALLAAIPPDCLRGSLLDVLPYVGAVAGLIACQTIFALGIFLRLRPDPTFEAVLWFRAAGMASYHALTFSIATAVMMNKTVPAGCRSPSWIEITIIGLCQLGHVLFLCREAHRISRLIAQEEAP